MTYWIAGERSRSEWRPRWLWCLALLLLTLAGCSLTTSYRYANRIILWQLDHYFDLKSDQRRDLNQRLTPLLTRHRHEALPEYESFLREIRQRIERGLTGSDVDWAYATYDRLRADLFERVAGTVESFSPRWTPARCARSKRFCRRTTPKPNVLFRTRQPSV